MQVHFTRTVLIRYKSFTAQVCLHCFRTRFFHRYQARKPNVNGRLIRFMLVMNPKLYRDSVIGVSVLSASLKRSRICIGCPKKNCAPFVWLLWRSFRFNHLVFTQKTAFTMTSVLLKFFQEHHLPRFNVDLSLNSVHCSQQCMTLLCTCSCNIMI